MENKIEIKKLKNDILEINIIIFGILAVIALCVVKQKNIDTQLTLKIAEISQKNNIEFATKTNNYFDVWTSIKSN